MKLANMSLLESEFCGFDSRLDYTHRMVQLVDTEVSKTSFYRFESCFDDYRTLTTKSQNDEIEDIGDLKPPG